MSHESDIRLTRRDALLFLGGGLLALTGVGDSWLASQQIDRQVQASVDQSPSDRQQSVERRVRSRLETGYNSSLQGNVDVAAKIGGVFLAALPLARISNAYRRQDEEADQR